MQREGHVHSEREYKGEVREGGEIYYDRDGNVQRKRVLRQYKQVTAKALGVH